MASGHRFGGSSQRDSTYQRFPSSTEPLKGIQVRDRDNRPCSVLKLSLFFPDIINISNKVGAVGFIGVSFPDFIQEKLLPLSVIKINKETGEPIRGADGLCIKADPGERMDIGQLFPNL